MGWAAVVLAGGRARRLGGVDKPALRVDGRTLLDVVLAACAGAAPTVVVGPRRPTGGEVLWRREQPWHGGPVAALAAGLAAVPEDAEYTAVLAADLPGLRPETVARLLAAVSGTDLPAVDGAVSGTGTPGSGGRGGVGTETAAAPEPGRAALVDGAVLVDEAARWQWLCGVWRTGALRRALAGVGDPRDRSMRSVLGGLRVVTVRARPGEAADVDTPGDVRALRVD